MRTHTVYSTECLVKHTSTTKITHTEPSPFTYASNIEYGVQTLGQMLIGSRSRATIDLNYATASDSDSDRSSDLEDDGAPYSGDKRGPRNMAYNINNETSAYKQNKAERVPTNDSCFHGDWPLMSAVDNSFHNKTDNYSLRLHGNSDQSQGWRGGCSEDLQISSFWQGRGRHCFETIAERHEEIEVHIHDHSQAFSDFGLCLRYLQF